MRKLACILVSHKWVVRRDPGVKPYVVCKRCQRTKLIDFSPDGVASGLFTPYDK